MSPAYVLVLSFCLGIGEGHPAVALQSLPCADDACVGTLLTAAKDSPYLCRVQVFKNGEQGLLNLSRKPLWPADKDWWLS